MSAPDSKELPDDQAPTLPPPSPAETREADEAATWLRERPTVPGHEILGELGRGGMGVVYKARHVKLQRLVALKMILAGGHASPATLARFQGEAEALARLQHPNIVQIFEAGEVNGLPFLSLEFVEGGSLAAQLSGEPWSPAEAARLVETLARAVAAAHQAGIVHRDLKPANVLLGTDGVPKITDFGLAKRLDAETMHTQSGAILGTPSYMAPEQAAAKGQEVGPATDVYALGAILYELLTGRPPFKAATPLETVLLVVADEPTPPRQLQPEAPRDLQTVCLKCLAKDPRQRYDSAASLAEDLRRFRENLPVKAMIRRKPRRRRWLDRLLVEVVLLVLLGLLAGGIALFVYNALRPTPPQRLPGLAPAPAALNPPIKFPKIPPIPKQTGTLNLWNTTTGEALATVQGTDGYTARMTFSPDGKLLAQVSQDNHVQVRDTTGRTLLHVEGSFAAFLPDSEELLVADGTGVPVTTTPDGAHKVRVWDERGRRNTFRVFGKSRGLFHAVALSRDGRHLAAVDSGGVEFVANEIKLLPLSLRVLDVQTGQDEFSRQLARAPLHLNFSPDGARLCASSVGDEKIRVWNVATGQEEVVGLRGHEVVFLGDGRQMATLWVGGPVKVWDAKSGQELYTIDVANAMFRPDGRRLAATDAGKAVIWDVVNNKELFTLQEKPHRIVRVAFSPDGKHLAGACQDGTVLVWDADSRERLHILKGHQKAPVHLLFNSDGQLLASASYDGQVQADNTPEKK
jgi:serine/threonine protein kinase